MKELERLVTREIPHLRRYARALTRDADAADDLVQETLEKALRKRHQWRRSGSIRAWLFTTLYRTYLNSRRGIAAKTARWSNANQVEEEAGGSEPPRQEHGLVFRDVAAALDQLPESQRAALMLVALEDLPYEEAASILGIPIGTLRSRVSRARGSLTAVLDDPDRQRPSIRRVK